MSSRTERIKCDASACKTAFTMSSGSYSRFALHEQVHQKRKEFRVTPKAMSFRNAEQCVMMPDIEQLSGLPKKSVVVRNVVSIA